MKKNKLEKDIKPCPFCNQIPSIRYVFGSVVISCDNDRCGLRPSTWLNAKANNFETLLKIWNNRKG